MGSVTNKTKKELLNEGFMLHNETGERLFHTVAHSLPIIDYHNHINPHHLARNHKFENITEMWLESDPYKHRAMRINGIPEYFISGAANPKDKFVQWAKTVPNTAGNPLFHWSVLELRRVFGVEEILDESNALEIWDHCNSMLRQPGFGAAELTEKWNAEIICTSDELLDELSGHKLPMESGRQFHVYPSLRCDAVLAFIETYPAYLKNLGETTGVPIRQLDDLKAALINRLDYFDLHGCRLADHALDAGFYFIVPSPVNVARTFTKVLHNDTITRNEAVELRSDLLLFLGQEYARRKWGMQLHIGAQRNTSSRLRLLAGAAGGYASIGTACDVASICSFLDALEKENSLPRTILYTLNPADNESLASLTGSFTEDGVPGKVQFGPAWWYNDHAEGIRKQLTSLANYGLLARFIGMTTDSRSILSLSRHEYFRRIFCNLLGEWVERGELPDDANLLDKIVQDVSYANIKNWF